MNQKRILIACEFSGIVREAFKKEGWDAWSCDLLPTEISGQHIQDNVLKHLNEGWDLMIAHPPCTYLSHAGARWLYPKGKLNKERYSKGLEAKAFFLKLLDAPIPLIAIENPLPSSIYGLPKFSQEIQPYQFGDEAQKRTLLWLKGLPNLVPTKVVGKGEFIIYKSGKRKAKWFQELFSLPPKERALLRSKTFQGIANAMAQQWGNII